MKIYWIQSKQQHFDLTLEQIFPASVGYLKSISNWQEIHL